MSTSEKKTFNVTKHEIASGEILHIINKSDLQEYARQAGFNQVQSGVWEEFATFLENEILAQCVQTAVFKADANKEKSLRVRHAAAAIEANHLIPRGHYL